MKHFTLATVNTLNEKFVNRSHVIKNLPESMNLSSWSSRHQSTTEGECHLLFEQEFCQKFQNKFYHLFFQRKILETGIVAP